MPTIRRVYALGSVGTPESSTATPEQYNGLPSLTNLFRAAAAAQQQQQQQEEAQLSSGGAAGTAAAAAAGAGQQMPGLRILQLAVQGAAHVGVDSRLRHCEWLDAYVQPGGGVPGVGVSPSQTRKTRRQSVAPASLAASTRASALRAASARSSSSGGGGPAPRVLRCEGSGPVQMMLLSDGTFITRSADWSLNGAIVALPPFALAPEEPATSGDEDAGRPTMLPSTIIDAAAGETHFVACDNYGRVFAWGHGNQYGQFGVGPTFAPREDLLGVHQPRLIPGFGRVEAASTINNHTASPDASVSAAANGSGSSGNSSPARGPRQQQQQYIQCTVLESRQPPEICAVACGRYHTVALATSRCCVYAWGRNHRGQLGFAAPKDRTHLPTSAADLIVGGGVTVVSIVPAPRAVPILVGQRVRNLCTASDGDHTLISLWDGRVVGFGDNTTNQLALGSASGHAVAGPVVVPVPLAEASRLYGATASPTDALEPIPLGPVSAAAATTTTAADSDAATAIPQPRRLKTLNPPKKTMAGSGAAAAAGGRMQSAASDGDGPTAAAAGQERGEDLVEPAVLQLSTSALHTAATDAAGRLLTAGIPPPRLQPPHHHNLVGAEASARNSVAGSPKRRMLLPPAGSTANPAAAPLAGVVPPLGAIGRRLSGPHVYGNSSDAASAPTAAKLQPVTLFDVDARGGDVVVCGRGFTALLTKRHNTIWVAGRVAGWLQPIVQLPAVVPLGEEEEVDGTSARSSSASPARASYHAPPAAPNFSIHWAAPPVIGGGVEAGAWTAVEVAPNRRVVGIHAAADGLLVTIDADE